MSTLIIRKKSLKTWLHTDSILGNFIISKFYFNADNVSFQIVEQGQSRRVIYNISDITVYALPSGGTAETFTTITELSLRLEELNYPAFQYDGQITSIANLIDSGTNVTITGDGTLASPYIISATGGGGGSQTLAETLVLGNITDGTDISISDGDAIALDNTSKLKKGTTNAGNGGNNGIALKCSLDYEFKWEAGRMYIMEQDGIGIRETRYNFNVSPTTTDDTTKGFAVNSRWILDNGDIYVCTDATTGSAVWELLRNEVQDIQSVLEQTNKVFTETDGDWTYELSAFIDEGGVKKFRIQILNTVTFVQALYELGTNGITQNVQNVDEDVVFETSDFTDGKVFQVFANGGSDNNIFRVPYKTITGVSSQLLRSDLPTGDYDLAIDSKVISANKTAVNGEPYVVTANSTFTDPTGVNGKGYIVYVRTGTATIGGVGYTAGSLVYRFYDGSWNSKDFGAGGATNLSNTPAPTKITVESSTGTDTDLPLADATNAGLLSPSEKTLISSIPNINTNAVDKITVKLALGITKGQAVYISSANGTNIIVSKASNTSEATSSKTLGLLETTGVTNDIVNVVTNGLLDGLDTSTATVGDAVWLGTSGNLIYGLASKPVAPAHLVYIGVVSRVSATVGEIIVKVQNGFELNEIHDVSISSVADNNLLAYESATSLWKNKTASTLGIAPLASPTFTGTVTTPAIIVSSETASTIASFNASKNIKSLDTATYPSLTELTYGKGVTSAIQTQLDNRKKYIVRTVATSASISPSTGVETILTSTLIASNSFSATDIMNFESLKLIKTGTAGSVAYKIYLNTSNSLSGATQIMQFTSAVAYTKIGNRTFNIESGNLKGFSFTSNGITNGVDVGTASAGESTMAFNPAVNNYLIVTAQLTASDSVVQRELIITK